MATVTERIRAFISSPKGQRLIDQGRRELAKPATQQKLRELATKFGKRR